MVDNSTSALTQAEAKGQPDAAAGKALAPKLRKALPGESPVSPGNGQVVDPAWHIRPGPKTASEKELYKDFRDSR